MRIYLSSTYEDLKDHRSAVAQTLRRYGHGVVAMEDDVASERRPLATSLEDIRGSDACVGIVAWRYGYVPPSEHGDTSGRSITESEYVEARAAGRPVLAFLADPKAAWAPVDTDWYTGENGAGTMVMAFRERLTAEHVTGFFSSTDQLASLVGPAMYELEGRMGLRAGALSAIAPAGGATGNIRPAMEEMQRHLQDTYRAFRGQGEQRDALRAKMTDRLQPDDHPALQHELFFAKYFVELTAEERFAFDRIRAITEGPLQVGNRRMLALINDNPSAMREIRILDTLRSHLSFWLNKYDNLFVRTPEMCVLYVGVEDRTPFPRAAESAVGARLSTPASGA